MATTLTASEATERLGVNRATLYAYVSRGLIRSEAGEGPSRARRYSAEDHRLPIETAETAKAHRG